MQLGMATIITGIAVQSETKCLGCPVQPDLENFLYAFELRTLIAHGFHYS